MKQPFRIKKQTKFRNKPVVIDGFYFPSQLEGDYYINLKWKEKAGLITFKRQVSFPMYINGVKITTYRADFVVNDLATGEVTVVDCKGFETPEYKIKRALMLALKGIKIFEVR